MPTGADRPDDRGDDATAPSGAADQAAVTPSPRMRAGRSVLALTGVMVAYYALPIGELPSSWDVALVALGLVAGLGALVWAGARQVRLLARAPAGDPSVRLDVLALVVIVVIPLFALGYYGIEQADADQFADLATKTDALYFTVSTLATVGFGDVHATGQAARALVTAQIVFNLVVVAALVSVLTTQLRARVAERRARGG